MSLRHVMFEGPKKTGGILDTTSPHRCCGKYARNSLGAAIPDLITKQMTLAVASKGGSP